MTLEPPSIQQGCDPHHESGDEPADDHESADNAESHQGPRDGASGEPDDIGTVHDDHVVRDRDPHCRDGQNGACDDGEPAAD
jgi:hypothetical protein